jgi:hypothetical protein
MSVGKYSPTVTAAYMADRDWWEKNGGGEGDDCNYDVDGYDRYGYNAEDVDRSGHTELDYLSSYVDALRNGDDEYPSDGAGLISHLAEDILSEWFFKDGKLAMRSK